jgi:hypothetical protein
MQQLTMGISNMQVNQGDNKLPSQTETNPKQCGAITSTEAITTRSGKSIEPILKTPYVAPHLRPSTLEAVETKVKEKEVAASTTMLEPMKTTVNVSTQRIPFPERLEKNKEDKQYAKFLDVMKDVQITLMACR